MTHLTYTHHLQFYRYRISVIQTTTDMFHLS